MTGPLTDKVMVGERERKRNRAMIGPSPDGQTSPNYQRPRFESNDPVNSTCQKNTPGERRALSDFTLWLGGAVLPYLGR